MTNEQKQISQAFLDGMYELFDVMFTNKIELKFIDDEHTYVDDLYKECEHKKYLEPIEILGKVVPDSTPAASPKMTVEKTLEIIVPAKSFIINGVDASLLNYKKFSQALITFDGIDYHIVSFVPKTLVGGTYLFYRIVCSDKYSERNRG